MTCNEQDIFSTRILAALTDEGKIRLDRNVITLPTPANLPSNWSQHTGSSGHPTGARTRVALWPDNIREGC